MKHGKRQPPPRTETPKPKLVAPSRPAGAGGGWHAGREDFGPVFALLHEATGTDFAVYNRPLIRHKIMRRMAIRKIKTTKDYVALLRDDRAEIDAANRDATTHSVAFFESLDLFDVLQRTVFPALSQRKRARESLRLWVPGCSTGEEVYCIAVQALTCLGRAARPDEIQIFGTDVSEHVLEHARAGLYSNAIVGAVPPNLLGRFFTKVAHGYEINNVVRDLCVFGRQNILQDPPLGRMDLISCRNLSIFVGTVFRQRILPRLHRALKLGGYLVLERSATLGEFAVQFATVNRQAKVFLKTLGPGKETRREDLAATREELASTAEELRSLNKELQNRNVELSMASSDLSNLFASVDIPILILDSNLCIRRFTPPVQKLLNVIPADIGRPVTHLRANLNVSGLEVFVLNALAETKEKEHEVQDRWGRWFAMRIRPYKTAEGVVDGAVITWVDITGLKSTLEGTKKALSAAKKSRQKLVDRSLSGVFRGTLKGRFRECNPAFARMFGFKSAAEVLATRPVDLFFNASDFEGFVDRLRRGKEVTNLELRLRRKDSTPVLILMNAVLVDGDNGRGAEIEGIVLDITERVRDITERKEAERALSRLSGQILDLQDAERRRMSRELHDTTGPLLTALIANLTLAGSSARALGARGSEALNESLVLAKECSRQIRTVSYLLHPPTLDELGLASALRWYVEGFALRSGLTVRLDLPPDLGRLPQDVETVCYRLVQESLTNVHLHSGSLKAKVRMMLTNGSAKLEIIDFGKGIRPVPDETAKKQDGRPRIGVGIGGMRERVKQLGGHFEIVSADTGTIVRAVLPIPASVS
jgi:PAS domain S-box-containing protein